MSKEDRTGIAIVFGTTVVVLILCGIAYGRNQYYKGIFDATNEHIVKLREIKEKLSLWATDKEEA